MKALVTGASSGLGRDMARELARRGYDLILVARRTELLHKLAEELHAEHEVTCQAIGVDLSDAPAIRQLYDQLRQEDISVLINNAGFGLFGQFEATDLERELEMINVNIRAVHMLTKLFLRDFRKKNDGYILNVASSAGFMAGPLMSTYYATKNYVLRLTQAIAEELHQAGSKVKVSALCPGPVDTEFNHVAKVHFTVPALKSQDVAMLAIEQLFHGKTIIIPGVFMKLTIFARRFAPEAVVTRIAYHCQSSKASGKTL